MRQFVQPEAVDTDFRAQIIFSYKMSIYTSQKAQPISITNTLILFTKIIGAYCEIHTEHTNRPSGEIQSILQR